MQLAKFLRHIHKCVNIIYHTQLCTIFVLVCLFFFHSVSNFVGFLLVKALPIGTGAPQYDRTLFLTPLASGARVGARVEV